VLHTLYIFIEIYYFTITSVCRIHLHWSRSLSPRDNVSINDHNSAPQKWILLPLFEWKQTFWRWKLMRTVISVSGGKWVMKPFGDNGHSWIKLLAKTVIIKPQTNCDNLWQQKRARWTWSWWYLLPLWKPVRHPQFWCRLSWSSNNIRPAALGVSSTTLWL